MNLALNYESNEQAHDFMQSKEISHAIDKFSESTQEKEAIENKPRKRATSLAFVDNSNSLLGLSALALNQSKEADTRIAYTNYNKQLIQTRNINYHSQSYKNSKESAEAQRKVVVRKVARELWTNFYMRGQETPMLEYLHTKLREEFGEDLIFYYDPSQIEVMIARKIDNKTIPLPQMEKVNIVNHSWKISQELVDSYTM